MGSGEFRASKFDINSKSLKLNLKKHALTFIPIFASFYIFCFYIQCHLRPQVAYLIGIGCLHLSSLTKEQPFLHQGTTRVKPLVQSNPLSFPSCSYLWEWFLHAHTKEQLGNNNGVPLQSRLFPCCFQVVPWYGNSCSLWGEECTIHPHQGVLPRRSWYILIC